MRPYPFVSVPSQIVLRIQFIHLQLAAICDGKRIYNKKVLSCAFCLLLLLVSGYFLQTLFPPSQRSFQGCMQAILVDDQLADLHAVEKGTMGAFENVSLDMCAIIDR